MMQPSEEKGAESEGPPTLPHPNIPQDAQRNQHMQTGTGSDS